jgi:hypothetical protein
VAQYFDHILQHLKRVSTAIANLFEPVRPGNCSFRLWGHTKMRHESQNRLWQLLCLVLLAYILFSHSEPQIIFKKRLLASEETHVLSKKNTSDPKDSACLTDETEGKKPKANRTYKEILDICESVYASVNNPFGEKSLKFCDIYMSENDEFVLKNIGGLAKSYEQGDLALGNFGSRSLSQYIDPAPWVQSEKKITLAMVAKPEDREPVIIEDIPQFILKFGPIDTKEKAEFFARNVFHITKFGNEICHVDDKECEANPIKGKDAYLDGQYWVFENYLSGYSNHDSGRCGEQIYTIGVSTQGNARVLASNPVPRDPEFRCWD